MIVYEDKKRYEIDLEEGYLQTAMTRVVVKAAPDKVTLSNASYLTGKRQDSGVRWWRWQIDSAMGLYRNKNGTLVPFYRAKRRNYSPAPVFSTLRGRHFNEQQRVFSEAVAEHLDVVNVGDVYPIAGLYGDPTYHAIPSGIVGAARAENMREFTAKAFGKKNVRKDLIKACAGVTLHDVAYAREFRNLVPVDWMVDFMRLQAERYEAYPHDKNSNPTMAMQYLRQFLLEIDPRSYRAILRRPLNATAIYHANDLLQTRRWGAWNFDRGNRFRSWDEAHDRVIGARRVVGSHTPFEDKEVKLISEAEKINELRAGKLIIRPVTHTAQMSEWGQEMHNCIGSYRMVALRGQGVYAGVYEGNILKANLEIKNGRLNQLLGKYNSTLPSAVRDDITTALKSAGISIPNDYWGARDLTEF